ncbi:MAG: helix-turn-helix domain-containing protein [Nocardioidaceae bacterium]
MADAGADRLVEAVRPLLERIGAHLVEPEEIAEGDVPLRWAGEVVRGVRLPASEQVVGASAPEALAAMIEDVEHALGGPLDELPRPRKQQAVRMLEDRGAFTHRRSAETVAEALGVSRFTVYNYLNRRR